MVVNNGEGYYQIQQTVVRIWYYQEVWMTQGLPQAINVLFFFSFVFRDILLVRVPVCRNGRSPVLCCAAVVLAQLQN